MPCTYLSRSQPENPNVDEVRELIVRFALTRGISPVKESSRSRDFTRCVYWLGNSLIAKGFPAEAREQYEREQEFLRMNAGKGRTPNLIASFFEIESGGYLVMTALDGHVVADVHETLSVEEYAEFVRELGKCMAEIHATPVDGVDYLARNNLETRRRAQFDAFPDIATRLRDAGVLARKTIPALSELVEVSREQAFLGSRGLVHGDLHSGNILLDQRNGNPWCSLIDFEESAFSFVELDFASPFIHVLGKAFPGCRFGKSWNLIWRNFSDGYTELSNEAPNLDLIVGHVVAWCLWGSARSMEGGQSRYLDLARSALGAATVSGNSGLARIASEAAR